MGLFNKKDKDEFRDDLTDSSEERHIELREEELRAEKERVEAGEVRLRKEVVEEQKTINVPVTREEVVVEKHSVGGRRPAEGSIGDDDEIRIPVMEEEVRVEKTPVVREEVSVRKRQVQGTEKVSDTVKREEAWVDRTEDATVRTRNGDWEGQERRTRTTSSYRGPERRVASV
jgi:uncharacterized protein (TIGR02271 family)